MGSQRRTRKRSPRGAREGTWRCFSASVVFMVLKQRWASESFPADSKSHHEWRATTSKQTKNRWQQTRWQIPGTSCEEAAEPRSPLSCLRRLLACWLRLFRGWEREGQLILSVECRAWEQRSLRPESAPSSVDVRFWVPGNTPTPTTQWDYS